MSVTHLHFPANTTEITRPLKIIPGLAIMTVTSDAIPPFVDAAADTSVVRLFCCNSENCDKYLDFPLRTANAIDNLILALQRVRNHCAPAEGTAPC